MSLPHTFPLRSGTVGNVVSERIVIGEYLDLRKITGKEWIREWKKLQNSIPILHHIYQ
jgi:hypothetical protein